MPSFAMSLAFFKSSAENVEGLMRGPWVASSSLMGVMTHEFLRQVDAFVEQQSIPVVHFKKGQRKDDVAAEHRARFQGTEGVLFLGKAQEKATVFRTEKRTDATGKKYPWIVKSATPVNQFYFYCIDEDFGPFFIKFCTYFPYNAKLCINGHEYVKRQLAKENIAFEALDNGVLSCADPKRLQSLCDDLSAAKIDALARKWLAKLPHPYPATDRQAGYRYDVSILQAEFSLTQVLDRPQTGRMIPITKREPVLIVWRGPGEAVSFIVSLAKQFSNRFLRCLVHATG
jgi:hypothetical protein